MVFNANVVTGSALLDKSYMVATDLPLEILAISLIENKIVAARDLALAVLDLTDDHRICNDNVADHLIGMLSNTAPDILHMPFLQIRDVVCRNLITWMIVGERQSFEGRHTRRIKHIAFVAVYLDDPCGIAFQP